MGAIRRASSAISYVLRSFTDDGKTRVIRQLNPRVPTDLRSGGAATLTSWSRTARRDVFATGVHRGLAVAIALCLVTTGCSAVSQDGTAPAVRSQQPVTTRSAAPRAVTPDAVIDLGGTSAGNHDRRVLGLGRDGPRVAEGPSRTQ